MKTRDEGLQNQLFHDINGKFRPGYLDYIFQQPYIKTNKQKLFECK